MVFIQQKAAKNISVEDAKQIYIDQSTEQRSMQVAYYRLIASLIFHFLFLFIDYFSLNGDQLKALLVAHGAFIGSSAFWFTWNRWNKFKIDLRFVLLFCSIVVSIAYGYVLHFATLDDTNWLLRAYLTTVMVLMFVIAINPNRKTALLVPSDLVALAAGALATHAHPDAVAISSTTVGFLMSTMITRHLYWRSVSIQAGKEFERQIKLAPVHIVVKSMMSHIPIETLFAPQNRWVCCISTDWRNYTSLASSRSASGLAEILNLYYDECHALLHATMPSEKYFCDWIADELFVVVFGDGSHEEGELVNQALDFANRLLMLKNKFCSSQGTPDAIDIGIAYGEAFTGILGPIQNRKATSIGDIPCRARRMQTGGKILRKFLGEKDRIIFGGETLRKLPTSLVVKTYVLPVDQKLRDLDDDTLYYIESLTEVESNPSDPTVLPFVS